jgi:hypothetical protein
LTVMLAKSTPGMLAAAESASDLTAYFTASDVADGVCAVWEVPLVAGDEHSHVLVRSTTDVTAQLLVRIGNRFHQVHASPSP